MTECVYRQEAFSVKVRLHFSHILGGAERIGALLLVLMGLDAILGIEPMAGNHLNLCSVPPALHSSYFKQNRFQFI